MTALVHSADVKDRDGGVLVMATLLGLYPFLLSYTPTVATRGQSSSRVWLGCAGL